MKLIAGRSAPLDHLCVIPVRIPPLSHYWFVLRFLPCLLCDHCIVNTHRFHYILYGDHPHHSLYIYFPRHCTVVAKWVFPSHAVPDVAP